MSEYTPITGELRAAMRQWGWVEKDGSITFSSASTPPSIDAEKSLAISGSVFDRLCDAIDAIHAGLERDNESLKAELDRVFGEGVPMTDENMATEGWVRKDKGHVISHVTVEVTPHIDWLRMADELDEFVEIVRGMAGGAK